MVRRHPDVRRSPETLAFISRRTGFEIWTIVACLVAGLSYLLGVPPPASVAGLLPNWFLLIWGASLFIGGLIGVAGILNKKLIIGMLVERSSLLILSGSMFSYAIGIFSVVGIPGILPGLLILGLGAAALGRVRTIGRELLLIHEWLQTRAELDRGE